jgi:N-acetyl-gamma-glutamylphosphate reductase
MHMDVRRLERTADKIIDAFADLRIEDRELIYVAMYVVIKSESTHILDRVVEFGEQVKWEIKNRERSNTNGQDKLF